MNQKMDITKDQLSDLYLNQHLTMQQIGDHFSVTRQAVKFKIDKFKINTQFAERFPIKCDHCGNEFLIFRKQYTKNKGKHYCNDDCYFADRAKNSIYSPHRNGQRIARIVMAQHLDRELLPGEIVHHKDGNCDNNMLKNHILFPDHSTHLKFHHALRHTGPNIKASDFGAYDPMEFNNDIKNDPRMKNSTTFFSISQKMTLIAKFIPTSKDNLNSTLNPQTWDF